MKHLAGGTAVVVTFDPHPAKFLRPEQSPRLLTATQHKIALIRALGVSLRAADRAERDAENDALNGPCIQELSTPVIPPARQSFALSD